VVTLSELGGWKAILGPLAAGADLSSEQTRAALGAILDGEATDAQIAAFIVALRIRGETVEEVSGMVDAMLATAEPIELDVDTVDIVGTGGSRTLGGRAFNVSTMASFVVAGAGAPVCKHGNRKASSASGSADLLEMLGVKVELHGPGVAACVEQVGIGFCYARSFHPAMRHVGSIRSELAVPTVFNFLGPLSHPARVKRQVIGVSDPTMAPTVIGVLRERDSVRAMVVHGHDGLDELTTTTISTVHELRGGEVTSYEVDPAAYGIAKAAVAEIAVGDTDANANATREVLGGETGPLRDMVVLNAAAGLVVADVASDLRDGIDRAATAIDSGAAARALERLVEVSNRVAT